MFAYKKEGPKEYPYLCTSELYYENDLLSGLHVDHEYFYIRSGRIRILTGYASDGLTLWRDKPEHIRAAFIHDALTQAIEINLIPKRYINTAHKVMYEVLLEDGSKWDAKVIYWGLMVLSGIYRAFKRVFV